jgi:hypothetical protein
MITLSLIVTAARMMQAYDDLIMATARTPHGVGTDTIMANAVCDACEIIAPLAGFLGVDRFSVADVSRINIRWS